MNKYTTVTGAPKYKALYQDAAKDVIKYMKMVEAQKEHISDLNDINKILQSDLADALDHQEESVKQTEEALDSYSKLAGIAWASIALNVLFFVMEVV